MSANRRPRIRQVLGGLVALTLTGCGLSMRPWPEGIHFPVEIYVVNQSRQHYALSIEESTPGYGLGALLVGGCEATTFFPEPLVAPFEVRGGPVQVVETSEVRPQPTRLFDSSSLPAGQGPFLYELRISPAGALSGRWLSGRAPRGAPRDACAGGVP